MSKKHKSEITHIPIKIKGKEIFRIYLGFFLLNILTFLGTYTTSKQNSKLDVIACIVFVYASFKLRVLNILRNQSIRVNKSSHKDIMKLIVKRDRIKSSFSMWESEGFSFLTFVSLVYFCYKSLLIISIPFISSDNFYIFSHLFVLIFYYFKYHWILFIATLLMFLLVCIPVISYLFMFLDKFIGNLAKKYEVAFNSKNSRKIFVNILLKLIGTNKRVTK